MTDKPHQRAGPAPRGAAAATLNRAALSFERLAIEAAVKRTRVAVVLGSGLGPLSRRLQNARAVSFAEVPGLAAPSVEGHKGWLTLGQWVGRPVLVFEGRLHYYEGHPWEAVAAPVRIAHDLGVRALLLTNAAGGINPAFRSGDLMAIRDHIEWNRPYCWRHPGPGGLGPARPSPYSPRLVQALERAGSDVGVFVQRGIYAALTGPSYETPAEIRALRAWGADAVGMSTAREAQAAFDLGMECAALSSITNLAAGLSSGPIHHGEVLATAESVRDRLGLLIERFLQIV